MTAAATPAASPPHAPHAVGLYLAVVQFFLAIGWVVYAAYLPQLAKAAGLPPQAVPWLLMADQLVFIATDLAVGLASDRAARVLGRIGRWVLLATLLSSAAFLALPWVAGLGSPALLVGVTLVWAVTSSALRAPPLTLLGRYVARPQQASMLALTSLGLGVAGAVAPYVALQLKGVDPVWPFLLSAACLAAVTLGMVAAERALAAQGARPGKPAAQPAGGPGMMPTVAFLSAAALGAAAFQWHGFVASAPLALRFAPAADLPWLLPAFWVGFNLALWPAGWLAKREGPWRAMALGAVMAAGGNAAAAFATELPLLLVAQGLAGAGWALLLCSAFSGALALGQGGHAGFFSGALNAVLAAAALARIAVVSQVAPPGPMVLNLAWLAAAGFALCALLSRWQAGHAAPSRAQG
jgi:hypothetical protein